ncbi:MAG: zf-HC2 domain-containing protein [Chloroflexota bacterium]
MNEHVIHQIPDYVLNLLPKAERQAVEQHTAVCSHCHKTLQAERDLGQMVRLTLQTATQPANGRLTQLMPAIPSHKQRRPGLVMGWQRQLAVVGLLMMVLLGSLGMWNGRSHTIWGAPSPTLAVTATSTQDATATLAQQATQVQETLAAQQLTLTAVASPTLEASITATPAPQPTPIAAIPARMATN